jgi:hypothetical protein
MDENSPDANETLLYELALRLAAYPGDPRVYDPQLLVGQLPPGIAIEIPLPEGSRLLGSLVRSQENIDIVLDCALSPDEVLQFYKERMAAGGWNELETMRPHHGGFVHSGFPMLWNHVVFCRGTQGPAFSVDAQAGKNARTDVRIDLNGSDKHSPCAQPNRMQQRRMHRDLQELIPMLYPPPGARQSGGGGGGSGDNWHSSAVLETDAGLPALAVHYNGQLARGGWTLSGEGLAGPLAWSTWTFQDKENEPWRGLFFILDTPGKDRHYVLEIRIDWDKQDNGGGGMRFMQGGGGYSFASLG